MTEVRTPLTVIGTVLLIDDTDTGGGDGMWLEGGDCGRPFKAGINDVGECKLTDDGL